MTIISTNFKKECLEVFKFSPMLGKIMSSLEADRINLTRLFIDEAIDGLQAQINQKIGEDEASIHNGRIESMFLMKSKWNELIDCIETQIDEKQKITL